MARVFLVDGFSTSCPEPMRNQLGDFWKRWHITYSRWLRDYLHSSRWFQRSLQSNITQLVHHFCDLWFLAYGATWGFVLWGCIHGIGPAHKRHRDVRRSKGLPPVETTTREIVWVVVYLFVCVSVTGCLSNTGFGEFFCLL